MAFEFPVAEVDEMMAIIAVVQGAYQAHLAGRVGPV